MPRCRGCQAEIAFVVTRTGARMPVEGAEPEEYRVWTTPPTGYRPGVTFRPLVLVTPEGDTLRVFLGVEETGEQRRVLDGPCRILGFESHFATCVQRDRFRR